MEINKLSIEGLITFIPKKFVDNRGYFFESFNQQVFNEAVGRKIIFVQDNESMSSENVLRGLHFQIPPYAQGKLVRVAHGSVLDIAVDLRQNSPTYGQWHAEFISAENRKMFWIPEGFAHGFVALENNTQFLYKCTNYYHPYSERTIIWNDNDLNIDWQIKNPLISEKDAQGIKWKDFISPYEL